MPKGWIPLDRLHGDPTRHGASSEHARPLAMLRIGLAALTRDWPVVQGPVGGAEFPGLHTNDVRPAVRLRLPDAGGVAP